MEQSVNLFLTYSDYFASKYKAKPVYIAKEVKLENDKHEECKTEDDTQMQNGN